MATRIEKWFERILMAAVLLEFLALVAIPLFAIPVHISRNFNEGWNAYFAQAALGHGVLYPAADSMLTNNYPPLSFYIVGAAGWLVGDNIVAGRLVAVQALRVIAFNVFRIGQWLGAERRLALLGIGVFLLGVYTMMPGYIGIDDPQFLAHALVTSGGVFFADDRATLVARHVAFFAADGPGWIGQAQRNFTAFGTLYLGSFLRPAAFRLFRDLRLGCGCGGLHAGLRAMGQADGRFGVVWNQADRLWPRMDADASGSAFSGALPDPRDTGTAAYDSSMRGVQSDCLSGQALLEGYWRY